jgi:hypothetical protein
MTVVLDAGALIAIDRRDRAVGAILRVAQQQRLPSDRAPVLSRRSGWMVRDRQTWRAS